MRAQGLPIYAAETAEPNTSLFAMDFPRDCAVVLGHERDGLTAEQLAECDAVVQIPCFGLKNSLNVSHAFTLLAYEYRRWHLPD